MAAEIRISPLEDPVFMKRGKSCLPVNGIFVCLSVFQCRVIKIG